MSRDSLVTDLSETWCVSEFDEERLDSFAKQMKMNRLLAKLLMQHGFEGDNISAVKRFVNPKKSLNSQFKNISSTENVDSALRRLAQLVKKKDKVFVNGDSDADGICGSTILVAALRFFGAVVDYDFPVRSKEGHGLQVRIIDKARAEGASLVITSDCGTKDVEAVDYANSLGLDVIITDHHILGETLPNALAVINPNLVDGETGEQRLSGSGVAFKLVVGLSKYIKRTYPKELYEYMLALAAIGTISDRMSLLEPLNRALIISGISALNHTKVAGLRALKEISFGHGGMVKAREISRAISPRLNAPGRIGDRSEGIPDSSLVVDLLLVGLKGVFQKPGGGIKKYIQQFLKVIDVEKSLVKQGDLVEDKADIVNEVNEERKKLTESIALELEVLLSDSYDPEKDNVVIVRGRNWNSGVIGIDADRLRDRFKKPVIIMTSYDGQKYLKGSVRSIPSINMYQLIERVQKRFPENPFRVEVDTQSGKQLVSAFGGHSVACGFTMHEQYFDQFCAYIKEEVSMLDHDSFLFRYNILDELKLSQINPELMHRLEKLSPFGEKFDYPLFLLKNSRLGSRIRPFGNKYQENLTPHVEFVVTDTPSGDKSSTKGRKIPATAFGLWRKFQEVVGDDRDGTYDLVFTLDNYRRNRGKSKSGSKNKIRIIVQDIARSISAS